MTVQHEKVVPWMIGVNILPGIKENKQKNKQKKASLDFRKRSWMDTREVFKFYIYFLLDIVSCFISTEKMCRKIKIKIWLPLACSTSWFLDITS